MRTFYRQEATDRVGKGRYCNEEGLRICSEDEFETVKKCIELTHRDLLCLRDIDIDVVIGAGAKSQTVGG